LLGYVKQFSRAVYGNYELVENLGESFKSPLDLRYDVAAELDPAQQTAYGNVTLLTFESYLKSSPSPLRSFALNRAFEIAGRAPPNLHLLDNSDSYYATDIYKKFEAAITFLSEAIKLLDKHNSYPTFRLRVDEDDFNAKTYIDAIAKAIFDLIFCASAVNGPFFTSWNIQHNMVWSKFMDDVEPTRVRRAVQHKLRRLLYDEILRMDKFANFKSARILGFCLNVMGLSTARHGFNKPQQALSRVAIDWARRSYLKLHENYPNVAKACLVGTITFDEKASLLIKTYAAGIENEPARQTLQLDPS
jgi:hypothetical protein